MISQACVTPCVRRYRHVAQIDENWCVIVCADAESREAHVGGSKLQV